MMNTVHSKASGPVLCRIPHRPAAVRAVVSRATASHASQAPHSHKVNNGEGTKSSQDAARKRKRKRAARKRAAAKKRSQDPNQANTVQQLCTSTAEYLKKSGEKASVNLNGRTLALEQQSAVQLSEDERPTATCFRSPHLQIWPRLTHPIDERNLLERVGQDDAYMDECLFSLQADSSAVVHRLSAADISNGTIELADGHCLFLDEPSGSLENVTFRGGALVLRGAKSISLANCSFVHCTLVATEGAGSTSLTPGVPNPTEVTLRNVDFVSSVHEGGGISIYANHSIVDAHECNIVGGWQGIAAHNHSSFDCTECVCKNAALIGIECHGSRMVLKHVSCECTPCAVGSMQARENLGGCDSHVEHIVREILAEASCMRLQDASGEFVGMLFGALLAHKQAHVIADSFVVSGYAYVGAHVRDCRAYVEDAGFASRGEALLVVSHGGDCMLVECATSRFGAFQKIGRFNVRVSGHGSFLQEHESVRSDDSLLVEKGARALLIDEYLRDAHEEGEEDYNSFPREKHLYEEVLVVDSGKGTLW